MSYDTNEEEFSMYDLFAEDKTSEDVSEGTDKTVQFDPTEELLTDIA